MRYDDDWYVIETDAGSDIGEQVATADSEADARLIAAAPTLLTQHEWNRRVRDSVDALLAEAGYAADSSARHQLSQMNFDAIALATSANLKEPQSP